VAGSPARPGENLASDEDHSARRRNKAGFVDVMAFFLFEDDGFNERSEILVGSAVAQQKAEIVVILAEKAGAELAVGSEADARAMAAESLRDGRDEADFARSAVGKPIFAGGLAGLVWNGNERPAGMDAGMDFRGRNNQVARPMAVGVEGHELNEAHDDAAIAREFGEGFDFILVETAHENGVDLDGSEAGGLRGVNAGHDGRKGFGAGDTLESCGIERVETDIDAAQSGGDKRRAAVAEEKTVGGHGKIGKAESGKA